MRKHCKAIIFTALAALLTLPGCQKKSAVKKEKTVRVTLQKMEERLFQHRIPIKGTVFPVQYATISAKTEGTIDKFFVEEGQHVAKGGNLFNIDGLKLQNAVIVKKEAVAVAETELATAEIELKLALTREEKAKFDLVRGKRLIKTKAMSTTNYEDAVVAEKAAAALVEKCRVAVRYRQATLIQAKTTLEIAQKDLRDSTVTAPFDCLITEKYQEEGEYVKSGSKLLKLENLQSLEIVAYLSANYHPLVRAGVTTAAIHFEGRSCGRCKITYCAETIDPLTRTFKIKIALPADTLLKSGMLCDLDVILAESRGRGVPESAVLQSGERFFIYTATPERKARSVTVRKGITDAGYTQILDAEKLQSPDVIVAGQRFVNENDKLSIAE